MIVKFFKTKIFAGILVAAILFDVFVGGACSAAEAVSSDSNKSEEQMKVVRISWEPIVNAVGYQLIITKNPEDKAHQALFVKNGIFSTGYELDLTNQPSLKDCYWSVCPVNSYCECIGDYTEPKLMSEQEWNPVAPLPTTEFDKMPYSLVYPVFSWIPVNNAYSYEVKVVRDDDTIPGKYKSIRDLYTYDNVLYEDAGYTWRGKYQWMVRAKNSKNEPLTQWSEPKAFFVETKAKVATLGDSITHGGGVVSVPPSYTMYNWETYCQVPIKNIGLSGDTVQGMLDRFNVEVLNFSPKILVIMGGVNNFRTGEDAWETIDVLERMRDRCLYNNIIPVFVTATPINEKLISTMSSISKPASNWKYEQQVLNQWVKQQTYWVDVTPPLTDSNGRLKESMSTDGLHPDYAAKKIIGEMIGDYLLKTFPYMNLLEK